MWQTIIVREPDCENTGLTLEICRSCGETKETYTPKGEHHYHTYTVAASCTAPGYVVQECVNCGDRQITSILDPIGHRYRTYTTSPACLTGGQTLHVCESCGESYTDAYTPALGHRWDTGTVIVEPGCTSQGVREYACQVCGAKRTEVLPATGHTPGTAATCTEPQLCLDCGAVLESAHNHRYTAAVTAPSCGKLGYTTYTCLDCGASYKGDYTDALGHNYIPTVTEPTCTARGYTTFICARCGDSYTDRYTEPSGHRWDAGTMMADATCNSEGVLVHHCLDCDAISLEAVSATGHTPGPAATCTEPRLCLNCGAVLEAPLGHVYQASVTEPTCEHMGYTTYLCLRCGDTYKADYTDPLGHSYTVRATEPTCTQAGYTVHTCERCRDEYVSDRTAALGHHWDGGTVIAEPTCTGAGVLVYVCTGCGLEHSETIPAAGHRPGTAATCTEDQLCTVCGAVLERAHGHHYRTEVTLPSCVNMGYTVYSCDLCGDSYREDYTDPLGHDYRQEVTPPTCTAEGYTTFTCARCGDSFVDRHTSALGHDWDDGTLLVDAACNADGVRVYQCRNCAATRFEAVSAAGHTPGPAATCTEDQLCTVCGAVLDRAHGHRYRAEVIPPSCTSMGYTVYTCDLCGDSYRSDYTDPLGHDFLPERAEATCTEAGHTLWRCSRCGESFITDRTAALGHRWDAGTVKIRPSCTGEGLMEFSCTACGEKRTETIPATGHTPGPAATCTEPQLCVVCGAVLESAHGHDFRAEVTEPTCLHMGWTTYTCADCGDSYLSNYTDALGHEYVPEVTPPTCTEGGFTVWTCAHCGDSYVSDFTEALGHDWDEGTAITDAGCGSKGVTEYRCHRCGETRLEAESATGHTPGPAATCTEDQLCTICGAVLDRAHGHHFRAEVTEPTCLHMGWTTYTCADCGDSYRSDYTDPLGHEYVPEVTAPTCTEGGFTVWTCAHCGDSYVSDYTEALGHDWDRGIKLVSTSCNGEGLIDHRCIRCDYHYLEAVSPMGHRPGPEATCHNPQVCLDCGAVLKPAKGHTYEKKVTEPTCEDMGYTVYTCKDCGHSYKSDYTKAKGHKESDWIIDKEPTFSAQGQRHKECTVCGKKLESEVIDKLYGTATTDSHGEAILGKYLVIVTDAASGAPIFGVSAALDKMGGISLRLPNGRLLDYADPCTVTVLLSADKSPVTGLALTVTDELGNYAAERTDAKGRITVPGTGCVTGPEGSATIGWTDANGRLHTFTVLVQTEVNGRPIPGAAVRMGYTGNLLITLPDGIDISEKNPIRITVTDWRRQPLPNITVILEGDRATETGVTDETGALVLPEFPQELHLEKHGAYIYGYPDGSFGPEREMTRCEAAAIFGRLLAEEKRELIPPIGNAQFTDIPENAWYEGYVRYLASYGIVYGNGSGLFRPEDPITRSEFVAMAVRYFGLCHGDPEFMEQYAGYNDLTEGYWAAEYIREATLYGWIKGYGDGSFRGEQSITRAEVVTLMNRLLGRTADQEYIAGHLRELAVFTDLSPKHWAYADVLEAANGHTALLDGPETWER